MNKPYCIIAPANGSRPETVEKGTLEKGMGQTSVSGEIVKVLNKRADVGFPNRTDAWGRRIGEKTRKDGQPVQVRDVDYKGEIEWLEWGHKDGQLIVARYLKGYNTIDEQYQNLVLNAQANLRDEDDEAFFIRIQSGDNYFDPEGDRYLVEMLRIHCLNESSKSKSPNAYNPMFVEKKEDDILDARQINEKFEALKIVNEASEDNSGKKMDNLYHVLEGLVVEGVAKNDYHKYLANLADSNPKEFLAQIAEYKRQSVLAFEKAKSYNVLDLTTDGFIVVGEGKEKRRFDEMPGKGDEMLNWMITNFLEDKSYETIFGIKQITENLK